MKKSALALAGLAGALLLASAAQAQIAPPNARGAALSHIHLFVKDAEAAKAFYLDLGGRLASFGREEAVTFPGVVLLIRRSDTAAPMEGSTIDHFGLAAKDGPALIARLKAKGVRMDRTGQSRDDSVPWRGAYVYGPGDVKIEILDRPEIRAPIQFDHVHFFIANRAGGEPAWPEVQAWYGKLFGARTVTDQMPPQPAGGGVVRVMSEVTPGVILSFSATAAAAPTKGRRVDHIGFNIEHLKAFCDQLVAQGVKLDTPYTISTNTGNGYAYLTDPAGTQVELNEKFEVVDPPPAPR